MVSERTPVPLDLDDLLSLDSGPLSGLAAPSAPAVKAAPAKPSDALISATDLADLFDLTPRRVGQLVDMGIIHKSGGRFDRRDCTRAYAACLRNQSQRGVAVNDELKAEKIRQAREAADKLAIQNAASRGEMVAASAVESAWSNVLREVRSMLLAVPSRCGASLPHLTTHDVRAIDGEIKSALRGLADDDA